MSGSLLRTPALPWSALHPDRAARTPARLHPSGPRLRVPPGSPALRSAAPQPPARTPAPSPRSSPRGTVGWAVPGGERPPGPQLELGVFGHWLGPARWRGGSPSPGARWADCGAGCPGAADGGLRLGTPSWLYGPLREPPRVGPEDSCGIPSNGSLGGFNERPPFLAGVGPLRGRVRAVRLGVGARRALCHLEPVSKGSCPGNLHSLARRPGTLGCLWRGSRAAGGRCLGSRPGALSFLCKSVDPPRHPQACSCPQSCPPPPCKPLSFGASICEGGGWSAVSWDHPDPQAPQTANVWGSTLGLCGVPGTQWTAAEQTRFL